MQRMIWVGLAIGAVLMVGTPAVLAAEAAEEEATTDEAAGTDEGADGAGEAPKVVETRSARDVAKAVWEKLKTGGWTMAFIGALSVAALAFLLERIFNLRKSRIVPAGLAEAADKLYKQGKAKEAQRLALSSRSTLGRMISYMVSHMHEDDPQELAVGVEDVAARELNRHDQRNYPLAVVGTLAPLLGLYGTVIGMMGAFETVATLGKLGDPSALAEDISKALITTAGGLFTAIPALFCYHFFKRRTTVFGIMLEEEASGLLHDWTKQKQGEE